MLRRSLLAPVICLIVMGFVGTSFSPLQARTMEKNVKPSEMAREHREKQYSAPNRADVPAAYRSADKAKAHKKKTDAPSVKKKSKPSASRKAAVHGKKSGSKKRIARHATKPLQRNIAVGSGSLQGTDSLSLPAISGQEPSDIWLAKDNPMAYRALRREELRGNLDKLTLNILHSAYRCLGIPYRYGGTTTAGFDCSGFVQHVFGENGITLGRSSRDQAREGVPVEISDLKPGDLVFFTMRPKRHNSIDHVGLYIGNGQFIHASSYRSREITIEDLESGSYLTKLVGARRILEYTSDEAIVIE